MMMAMLPPISAENRPNPRLTIPCADRTTILGFWYFEFIEVLRMSGDIIQSLATAADFSELRKWLTSEQP